MKFQYTKAADNKRKTRRKLQKHTILGKRDGQIKSRIAMFQFMVRTYAYVFVSLSNILMEYCILGDSLLHLLLQLRGQTRCR